MAAVTLCSDLGAQENKICHCFNFFPFYLPGSDGTRCHDLSFLNAEFQANFFTLLFNPHQDALGMTQRDGMGREVGGGFRMGNTCTPMVDSCQCMAKPIKYCKVKK